MIVHALAPAKLNLGLEILGRRADGFHEIRSVMVAVSLFDRLSFEIADEQSFHVDDPLLHGQPNLVEAAIERFRQVRPGINARASLQKRIPSAAGLGGASSDAAATLIALDRAFVSSLSTDTMAALAGELGSDVPFFLTGGRTMASGRGEVITPLPSLRSLFAVIVVSSLQIPAKTATLYGALLPSDYSDGTRVDVSARSTEPTSELLTNAFERALYTLAPELTAIPEAMRHCGATIVALSGAGPAHYALEHEIERAHALAQRVRSRLPRSVRVHVVRTIAHGVVISSTGPVHGDLAE